MKRKNTNKCTCDKYIYILLVIVLNQVLTFQKLFFLHLRLLFHDDFGYWLEAAI